MGNRFSKTATSHGPAGTQSGLAFLQRFAAGLEHGLVAPVHAARQHRHADAQERECGLDEDVVGDDRRAEHQQRPPHLREDVHEQQPPWTRADGSHGYFTTVWQRTAGKWRWVYDGGGNAQSVVPYLPLSELIATTEIVEGFDLADAQVDIQVLFAVLAAFGAPDDIRARMAEVGAQLLALRLAVLFHHARGPIAKPRQIMVVEELPKTRSGKIMRRILRKIACNELDSLGDTSTLADPSVVQGLIDKRLNQ